MHDSETEDAALRTLIVDDEPLAVERVQVICAEIPAVRVVGTASDGAAALRLAEKLAPDLVLLDMTMPEMDGLGVARHFAEQSQSPVVIFVTAHDHFAVEAFDLEAVDYVLKPVSADRLERAIERVVARRGQRRQHPALVRDIQPQLRGKIGANLPLPLHLNPFIGIFLVTGDVFAIIPVNHNAAPGVQIANNRIARQGPVADIL